MAPAARIFHHFARAQDGAQLIIEIESVDDLQAWFRVTTVRH
jgi:hypothetical protein